MRQETRLHHFLVAREIPFARLATASGFTRKQILRWRLNHTDIQRRHMVRVLCAVRRLTGENIRMDELFLLEPNSRDCDGAQ